ncbi:MAG: FlgD immunoglobulin-like domain containing protein [bacterium]
MNCKLFQMGRTLFLAALFWLCTPLLLFSQANLLFNGNFDQADRPELWQRATTGNTSAQVIWASDRARSGDRSAKIVKSDTDGEAMWVSENMNQYWTRSFGAGGLGGFAPNLELEVGGWIQTMGVNTNPGTDAEMIVLAFSFYDSSGAQIFGEDVVVPFPQDQATIDTWTEVKSIPFILPVRSDSVVMTFKFGTGATGTAWADDLFLRKVDPNASGWEGDIFNNSFNAPAGWFYWWQDFTRGAVPVTATVTEEDFRSAPSSLKIEETDDDGDEVVFISDITPIDASQNYVLSAWVKTQDFSADSAATNNAFQIWFTWTWHRALRDQGWEEIRAEDYALNIPAANTDWNLYAVVITPPEDAVGVSVRARYRNLTTGTSYWDDFSLREVSDTGNVLANRNFDQADRPELWQRATTGNTSAQVIWASDRARSGDRSAKIVKSDTDGEAMWVSENMNQYWTRSFGAGGLGGFAPNLELEVGGWIQTMGVNTNPGTDAEMIVLAFSFYDSSGAQIFGEDVVVPFPQDQATIDTWTEVKSIPFILPVRSDSVVMTFKFGTGATGTAWADDLFLRKVDPNASGWEGDIFNNSFNAPAGWFYWWQDFTRGAVPVTATVTEEDFRSAPSSLKIEETDDDGDEVVFISDITPIDASQNYVLSAWVKTQDFSADSAATNNAFQIWFTWTWHRALRDQGWEEIRAEDFPLPVQAATTDWTQYSVILQPPEDAVGVSVRARYRNLTTGISYWDDFLVTPVEVTSVENPGDFDGRPSGVPERFELAQNFPNPFNPSTTIEYKVAKATNLTLDIYNLLGQKIRSLIDQPQAPGTYRVQWNGRDDQGRQVSSGIYIYRFQAGNRVFFNKMTLLK